jgi:uncharacterized Zn-binding protein involved in type VI secretion
MGSPILTTAATVLCPHGGAAMITPSAPSVTIDGQPVALQSDTTVVAGCVFTLPGPKPSPCVSVQWLAAAMRVTVRGKPVLLLSTPGVAKSPEQLPQGPASVAPAGARVTGQ